jgi:hypothetical protein
MPGMVVAQVHVPFWIMAKAAKGNGRKMGRSYSRVVME